MGVGAWGCVPKCRHSGVKAGDLGPFDGGIGNAFRLLRIQSRPLDAARVVKSGPHEL